MSGIRLLYQLMVILSLLCVPGMVVSQENGGEEQGIKERFAQLIEARQQEPSHGGSLPQSQLPFATPGFELNADNQAMQQQAIKQYFQHVIESNAHQRRVFRWQLLSAKIIFVVVILLVVAGIYFAAVQFHQGMASGKIAGQETEFEASLKGIKVSSPVLGVIILSISLVFFYLYLVHVYPIEFVQG